MGRRIGRRMFLVGAGGVMLGIPTLTSLLPRELAAQAVPPTRRFLSMVSFSGQWNFNWLPTWQPAGYSLRDALPEFAGTPRAEGTTHLHLPLPEDARYGYAPLADFRSDTGISRVLTERLNPFLDKLTLIRGLDIVAHPGHGYGGGAALGNYMDGVDNAALRESGSQAIPTIDQVLAYSTRFYPERPALRSLHVGTGSPNSCSFTDYGMSGAEVEQLSQYLDPREVWDQLFLGLATEETPREDPNVSFLNLVHQDFQRVRAHRRLGAADRRLLDRHLSFLSDIEADMANRDRRMCVRPDAPPSIENGYPYTETGSIDDFRATISLLIELSVAAIRCDLTRVVTMKIQEVLHDTAGSWVGSYHNSADVPSDWHHYAHGWQDSDFNLSALTGLNRWITNEVFVRLLEGLDVEEADGRTYLDNSLVYWGNELSLSHYNVNMPTLVAGGAGGAWSPGRYVDYSNWDATGGLTRTLPEGLLIPGVPHNRFLVSCLQAMGLRSEDYEHGTPGYGDPGVGSMPYSWTSEAWDLSRNGEPLPGLLRT